MSNEVLDRPTGPADLLDALREVDDPEWPVSVVDLGLVRSITVEGRSARVEMTFTSVGCPFVDSICGAVRERLLAEESLDDVVVNVTWRPWSSAAMSRTATARFAGWGVAL